MSAVVLITRERAERILATCILIRAGQVKFNLAPAGWKGTVDSRLASHNICVSYVETTTGWEGVSSACTQEIMPFSPVRRQLASTKWLAWHRSRVLHAYTHTHTKRVGFNIDEQTHAGGGLQGQRPVHLPQGCSTVSDCPPLPDGTGLVNCCRAFGSALWHASAHREWN